MPRNFLKKLVILPALLLTTTLTLTNCSSIQTSTLTNELKKMEGINEVKTLPEIDYIMISVQPGFKVEQFNKIKCNNSLNIQQGNPETELRIEQTYNSNTNVTLTTLSESDKCERFEQEDLDDTWNLTQIPGIKITELRFDKPNKTLEIITPNCYNDEKIIEENIALLEKISEKETFKQIEKYNYCLQIKLDRTRNNSTDNNSYAELIGTLKILNQNNVHATVKMDDILTTLSTEPGTGIPDAVLQELETTYPDLAFKDTTEKPKN